MKRMLLVLTMVAMIAKMITLAVTPAAVEQDERDLLIVEPCDPGTPLCPIWV